LRHILNSKQFTREDINDIIAYADQIRDYREYRTKYKKSLKGKILATLFFEPSTRTRLSFESAMYRLGGRVISTENALQSSSYMKHESLEDNLKIVSKYADIIVLRHYREDIEEAIEYSSVPVINAGSGSAEHPTQALLDIYTVKQKLDRLDNLHYCFVGDLKYGRTVRSLINLLKIFDNIKITLVSTEYFSLPENLLNDNMVQVRSLDEALEDKPNVVYMTRTQKERLDKQIYSNFVFGVEQLDKLKDNAIIMHPLPRNDEIHPDVDKDSRAVYFDQAANGLLVRASLLYLLGG
jgi:aspartate carbamoyltransferase catalytic subunit